MEEKNELNDIILNKGSSGGNNKKVILAVATLGVILIIVVMLMNTLTSTGTDNLPQAVLPPEPKVVSNPIANEEPLFEEVEVVQEEPILSDNLDSIAQKLKKESLAEAEVIEEPIAPKPLKKVTTKKQVAKKAVAPSVDNSRTAYYIQVGSFSKYAPNRKFLQSITDRGYSYKYHKVKRNGTILNKVLIGPFYNEKEAKRERINIRSNIEAGAFLIKL